MRLIDADALFAKAELLNKRERRAVQGALLVSPTIEADPVRHGRWFKQTELDEDGNAWYLCSECGYGDKHAESVDVPFCWHCGAKMDKEI